MSYVLLSLVKVFDNIIGTAKSIATYQEKIILSSVLVAVSQLLFYLVIDQVVSDGSLLVIFIVAISSGVGNCIAFLINNKFKKDAKWTVILTCSCIEDVKELCGYLAANKIKYLANNGYNRSWQDTINVIAFSKTKEESRLIDEYLENTNHKYLKEVLK